MLILDSQANHSRGKIGEVSLCSTVALQKPQSCAGCNAGILPVPEQDRIALLLCGVHKLAREIDAFEKEK